MRDHNIKYWCETSAKSGQNIEGLFLNATKFLYNQMNEPDGATETSESDIGGDNSKSSNSHMGSIPQNSRGNSPKFNNPNSVKQPSPEPAPVRLNQNLHQETAHNPV